MKFGSYLLHFFCQIWKIFGTGDVHENVFEAYQFLENQCRGSHTILVDINEFCYIKINYPFLMKFFIRDQRKRFRAVIPKVCSVYSKEPATSSQVIGGCISEMATLMFNCFELKE
jgi:hypothetical protein